MFPKDPCPSKLLLLPFFIFTITIGISIISIFFFFFFAVALILILILTFTIIANLIYVFCLGQKHTDEGVFFFFVQRDSTQPPSIQSIHSHRRQTAPHLPLWHRRRSQRPFSLSIAERSRPPRNYPLRNTNWPHTRHGAAISRLSTPYSLHHKAKARFLTWPCGLPL
ncbi:hypothetical protein J3F84DRAFT_369051 [Trichoderma pleuroticola]